LIPPGRPASSPKVIAWAFRPVWVIVIGAIWPGACAAPNRYVPPAVDAAPAFKENANWKVSQPADQAIRGSWWEMFGDAELNALEAQIDVSNQNLKAAEAQFEQARALVRGTRSELFPQVTVAPSISRVSLSSNAPLTPPNTAYGEFLLPGDVSYEADVWGRIHKAVDVSRTAAQASAADLETARLSVHAELALDYFMLHGLDRERQVLDRTVTGYERAVELTQNQFRGGLVSQVDVALAETQLESTRAQAVDIEVERAALEHAIAVLLARPASTFAVAVSPLTATPPDIPAGLPSDLLERRPDIAAAERRVASASAEVGVTTAALYPVVTLSGMAGFESTSFGRWLAAASNFWSVGPAALVTVFDAGHLRSARDQARAAFGQTEALYRDTVLSAFRDVEDELVALRVLEEEATIQDRATEAAQRSLTLATNRYRGGVATYLEVIVAQTAALTNERAGVTILERRMSASVLLLKALGGGWTASRLPQAQAIASVK
jgi:NodT family efflux transporter outer membrane factor (OMF) lipoprotein